ncbi:MAG: Tm-1-like ATP-binding domain-containing protein [Syntrophorhabdales bacterium]|jgi:uncharacterized protein (UPF0261 family)
MRTVLLLTCLDTRHDEALYLKTLIECRGCKVIMVDISMGACRECGAEYTCIDVAREGGTSFEKISSHKSASAIIEPMVRGCTNITKRLYEQGAIDAIVGFGGTSNTLFVSSVMAALPFGFAKIILCSSAAMPAYSARFFANKDITISHACVEINGLNRFVKEMLRRFAGMVAGVALVEGSRESDVGRRAAITEYQFSETCARRIRDRCATANFEMIPFHAQGVGERIMEEMVAEGLFDAVIDLVPAGLSEAIIGGNRSAGLDRLDRELSRGVPIIFTPCGFDMVSCGPYERRSDRFWERKSIAKRKLYVQDELRVQARTTKHEMQVIGRVFAEKLSRAKGPTALYLPLKGFSSLSVEGGPLHDPESDMAFVRSLKNHMAGGCGLELVEMDCGVDDPSFADSVADHLLTIMSRPLAQPSIQHT